jgi:hypothetical protein
MVQSKFTIHKYVKLGNGCWRYKKAALYSTASKSLLLLKPRFTHTLEMDWMLPGIAPTGKRVECGLVVIVHFRGKKPSSEHIYWDQASVLAQIGLIDTSRLPVLALPHKTAIPPHNGFLELVSGPQCPIVEVASRLRFLQKTASIENPVISLEP